MLSRRIWVASSAVITDGSGSSGSSSVGFDIKIYPTIAAHIKAAMIATVRITEVPVLFKVTPFTRTEFVSIKI